MPKVHTPLTTLLLHAIKGSAVPLSTPDLIAAFGRGRHPRETTWTALITLRKAGHIQSERKPNPATRYYATFWAPAELEGRAG